jgi:NADPH:quinone reductase
MRALFATRRGDVELRELPWKETPPGEVGIRVITSLISSGTERHYLEQAQATGQELQLGYCAVGVVERLEAGVSCFSLGDRVAALGWGYAVHAEYINVPYRLCVKLPSGPTQPFVFAPLAATVLHLIHRSRIMRGEKVLIIGAGPVGQIGVQLARSLGCEIYVADVFENRLRAAEAGGATAIFNAREPLAKAVRESTSGQGVAAVFLCVSGYATEVFRESLMSLHAATDGNRKGRLMAVGRFRAQVDFSAEMGNVDILVSSRCGTGYRDDRYVHGEVDYDAPHGEGTVDSNLKACVDLIDSGALRPDVFHTHSIPFAEATLAYGLLSKPDQAIAITLEYPDCQIT